LVASGADVIAEVSGGKGPFSAFGWAKAQLDVLCLQVSVPIVPAGATLPVRTVPAETADVNPRSRTGG
jgi:hypothetical protein